MSIPFSAFGNDELKDAPRVDAGTPICCSHCGACHTLKGGHYTDTGEPTTALLTYHCGDKTYLAAVDHKLLPGITLYAAPNIEAWGS